MSRINGEKARAAVARKRRSAQRLKDRVLRAKMIENRAAEAKAEKKPAPAKKKKKPAPEAPAAEVKTTAPEEKKPKARKKKTEESAS